MELDDFSPLRLLQREELNVMRKLRRRVERIHLDRRLDGTKPAARQKGVEHFWDQWRAVHTELEARSFDAIRALGIGEHSVLHIIRDGGYESWFQLRSAELSAFFDGREAWKFEGGAAHEAA